MMRNKNIIEPQDPQCVQTSVMPSAFVLKKCTRCNLEFPKTDGYFFGKITKQQNKNGLAIYHSFRAICKKCNREKGEENRVKKRCKELNCDISDYRNNWKKQYSKTRTFDLEAKEKLSKGQYAHFRTLLSNGIIYNTESYLKHILESKKERNILLSNIAQSKRKYFGKEEKRLALRKYAKNEMLRLTDAYVANVVMKKPIKELSKEIIETKRLIIKLKRQLNYGN